MLIEAGQTGDAESAIRDVEQPLDGERARLVVGEHDDVRTLRLDDEREVLGVGERERAVPRTGGGLVAPTISNGETRSRCTAAVISVMAVVPTTSTRRLVVRSTTQPQVPLESRTPQYMARRAPSEKRKSARCGLSAATHTRPVVAPIAAGTHGPSA